jgi:hypothetical protein
MSSEDMKNNAPAGELGANSKAEDDSIKSAADCQLSMGPNQEGFAEPVSGVAEPANDDLNSPGVEVCEGALSKWGNPNCEGYCYKEDGSLWEVGKDGETGKLVSPNYIKVIAFKRTIEDEEWKIQIEFINHQKCPHTIIVSF